MSSSNHRHRSRSMVRIVATLAVLLLGLAACSGADSPEEGSGAASEAAPAAGGEEGTAVAADAACSDSGEPIEVTAWFNGETVPADDFAQLEEEHNVVVNWDIRGDAILTDMLRMRDAGEQLPDLVEIDSHLVPAFMEAGLLAPMTAQVQRWEEEDPELYETVPASVWEDGTYDGEIYHWPNKSLVNAIFYNISLLEEAGVEPTFDTWWDVVDAARAVQEVRPDLPAYFGTGGTSHDRMFRWAYNFGVPFEGNVPDLTSEQGVEMIDFLQTMYEEGITDPEFMIGQQDESKGAFVAQTLPLISEGLNGGPGFMLDDFVYGEDWATTPSPVHEESGGQYLGVPRGWSMSEGTQHPCEASLALRYIAQPDIAAERYFQLESGVPQSIPVLERVPEEQPFFTQELVDIFRSLEAQVPPGTNTNAVGEVLVDLVEELTVTGTEESPEQVAERYQAMLEDL
jgi:ABC-type glycerol-3-phosphate transport system substrate-binding protein